MKSVRIEIYGKVQGVFFRVETIDMAKRIGGLRGYVKNESDGSVLVEATGEDKKIESLIEWCRSGPKNAKVDKIIVRPVKKLMVERDFQLRR